MVSYNILLYFFKCDYNVIKYEEMEIYCIIWDIATILRGKG